MAGAPAWLRTAWRGLAAHGDRIASAALLVTLVCVLVPLHPLGPGALLDDAWTLAMNEAVGRGYAFGRDIVFTFGPYASVFTWAYHPATDTMMLVASGYLAVGYWAAIITLREPGDRRYPRWLLLVVLAALMYSRDALLLSYPLVAGLLAHRVATRPQPPGQRELAVLAGVFGSFGLLPLVKGSLFVVCTLIGGVCVAELALARRWRAVATVVGAPLVVMIIAWLAAGQPLTTLPAYVRSALPVIAGYTDAMALPGRVLEVVVYLVGASVLAGVALMVAPGTRRQRGFVTAIVVAFLFVAFKAGFVRHDSHAVIAGTSLLFGAVSLSLVVPSRFALVALATAAVGWGVIVRGHLPISPSMAVSTLVRTYDEAQYGLRTRLTSDAPQVAFERGLARWKQVLALPALEGTVDVYSNGQTGVIASGLQWSPRPVVQSYAAYEPFLAELNRAHLAGPRAPDHVLLEVEPIDAHLPPLEDGPSWPELLARYEPVALRRDTLQLRRRAGATGPVMTELSRVTGRLGKPLRVPDSPDGVVAVIDVRPSLPGRLASAVFRSSALVIDVELEHGQKRTYRLIPNMARAGFVLSPLVESTLDFGLLYGGRGYLDGKQVRTITIRPDGTKLWWQRRFSVRFLQLPLVRVVRPHLLLPIASQVAASGQLLESGRCDGVIDVINGMISPPGEVTSNDLLTVSGWSAPDAARGELAELVHLALVDEQGRATLFETRSRTRSDVASYFKQPALERAGYAAAIDLAGMPAGRYGLRMAVHQRGRTWLCEPALHFVTITPP